MIYFPHSLVCLCYTLNPPRFAVGAGFSLPAVWVLFIRLYFFWGDLWMIARDKELSNGEVFKRSTRAKQKGVAYGRPSDTTNPAPVMSYCRVFDRSQYKKRKNRKGLTFP